MMLLTWIVFSSREILLIFVNNRLSECHLQMIRLDAFFIHLKESRRKSKIYLDDLIKAEINSKWCRVLILFFFEIQNSFQL